MEKTTRNRLAHYVKWKTEIIITLNFATDEDEMRAVMRQGGKIALIRRMELQKE